MDFILKKGQNFEEEFVFKNESGGVIAVPTGNFRLILERGAFAKEYTIGKGLTRLRTKLLWTIPKAETATFEYGTLYYTLYLVNTEMARGVVKVQ